MTKANKKIIVSALALVTIALHAYCGSGRATVSIVGDIMLDRGVEEIMEERGYAHPYEKVSRIFLEDDMTLGNLECPITETENPALKRRDIVFRAKKKNAIELKVAGFDVLNLANNHSMDQRSKGLKDTIDMLNYQGISTVGAGENREEAREHVVTKIKGVKIGILGYSAFPPEGFVFSEKDYDVARIDAKSLKDEVSTAKKDCDFLIATIHWGNEYDNYPSEMQRDLARMMVDSGADAIVGHHPHVLQGVEKYMGKYIFYSLGNFVFDRQIPKGTDISVILQLNISKNGCEDIDLIPVKIENAQPRPAYGAERDYIFKRIILYSNGMGAQGELEKWAGS